MRKRIIYSVIIVLIYSSLSYGQGDQMQVRITEWFNNCPGAVSVTFDDACITQYQCAYPVMEKLGIKGTFSIVGEWIQEDISHSSEPDHFSIPRMGWKQFRELEVHGHEIAAHGFIHSRYDKHLPVNELAGQMKQIKDLIEENISGRVVTMHYPYSFASGNIPVAAAVAGYLFGRSGLDTVNSYRPQNMLLLASQSVLNSQRPDSAMFMEWMDSARGNWLILMYHHLFSPDSREMGLLELHHVVNTYSLTPDEFEKQMKWLAASGYWLAPVGAAGRYATERDNTTLNVTSSHNKIIIQCNSRLDISLYDHPLTLEIFTPWEHTRVEGSLDDGLFETGTDPICINIMPGGKLTLTKKKP